MMDVFPINDFGPLMPGLVMGGVAIVHVFLAQFAVGGGLLLCYFQWLAMTGRHPDAARFVHGYFKTVVLVSFVLGALTGVGIWFTAIQVSPATIGAMVHHFHWLWAAEWTLFCLEIVAGYCFYRCHDRLNDRQSLTLLVIYAGASWGSLFIINGILSWQLTPGMWLESHRVAAGFFNPSFWPSLLFRTVVSMTLAGLGACVVINAMSLSRESRHTLINRAAHCLIPMAVMPLLGVWYITSMPADSRSWIMGASPAMMLFFNISIAASLAIGGYALVGLVYQRLYINGATATLLMLLAFGATAGGEFVREGARKPYSIRNVLYSNAIAPNEVARLRVVGCLADDPYPIQDAGTYPNDPIRDGARVFRRNCSVCHTMSGANAVGHLTDSWDVDQMRMNIAKLQQTKPYMPPFAGTAIELESLVQFILWHRAGQPSTWSLEAPWSENATHAKSPVPQIQRWLDEAGVEPSRFREHREHVRVKP